jgi:hypothetical protein
VKRVLLLLGAAIALSACASPPSSSPHLTEARTHAVKHPILGVDLYAQHDYPAAQVESDGQRTIAYIKNVLHADAVGIVWDFFQTKHGSNQVRSTKDTLTPANVKILTTIAAQYHLRVEYRPLIFSTREISPWEGHIYPSHPAAWFDSYFTAEQPYLRVAQHMHVPEFVVETEMHALNRNPLWPSLLHRVARAYSGTVSYASWDEDYFPATRHLLPVGRLAMDMYAPLNLSPTATPAQVAKAWAARFRTVPASILHRTAIDETGIQARAGAYDHPADMYRTGREANNVQTNWFRAACQTVHTFGLRGVYFWKVDLTDYPDHPATSLSTFEGRPSASTISTYCRRVLS